MNHITIYSIMCKGYVTHEAGGWSDKIHKWVFMPRKVSTLGFENAHDERCGSNVVLIADESFDNIEVG
jgi:soluble calcium-activated nucleotidase 1